MKTNTKRIHAVQIVAGVIAVFITAMLAAAIYESLTPLLSEPADPATSVAPPSAPPSGPGVSERKGLIETWAEFRAFAALQPLEAMHTALALPPREENMIFLTIAATEWGRADLPALLKFWRQDPRDNIAERAVALGIGVLDTLDLAVLDDADPMTPVIVMSYWIRRVETETAKLEAYAASRALGSEVRQSAMWALGTASSSPEAQKHAVEIKQAQTAYEKR